jgi:hypothetical protein
MHLGVKNCSHTACPAVAVWDSWAPYSHKFFSSPVVQSVSNERFPSSCSPYQQSFGLNVWSDQTSPLTCAVLSRAHLQQGSAFRKHIVPAKGLCSWHCIISKHLLKFSMYCGGTVTELKKIGGGGSFCYVMFSPPIFMARFTNISGHVKHLLHTVALHSHATAGGDGGKDQGQRLSMLADGSIACTTRRKLISLLYCSTL